MLKTPSNISEGSTESGRRMHGLDALRAGALLLGILLHGLLPFVPGFTWVIGDKNPRTYALPVVTVIHTFRMAIFFLLSGYFSHLVVQRGGLIPFLRERMIRIGLPVFVFWPISVMPLGFIMLIWYKANALTLPASASHANFTTGQLWFLWVLLQCCFIMGIAYVTAYRVVPKTFEWIGDRIAGVMCSPLGILILAIPFYIAQNLQGSSLARVAGPRGILVMPSGLVSYAGITEPRGLMPDPSGLIAYFSAYLAGWILWRNKESIRLIGKHWVMYLAIAVIGSAATLYFAGFLGGSPAHGVRIFVLSGTSAITAWAWTYGLLGVCGTRLDKDRFWVRYLADASYWMYLLHLPILVGIGGLLTGVRIPAEFKILITLGATSAVLLLTYDAFVRSTYIGEWLNGHRRSREIFIRRQGSIGSDITPR